MNDMSLLNLSCKKLYLAVALFFDTTE